MIKNSKENGNNVFPFGPKNNEKSHIAVLPLCWDDLESVLKLLSIPGGDRKEKLRLQTVENLPECRN